MKMSPNGVSSGNENGYHPVATVEEEPCEDETCQEIKKESQPKDSEESSEADSDNADLIVPPDGGWGWVIVFGSFLSNVVVDGNTNAFGMFFNDITTTLQTSVANVALVGSLSSGFYLGAGPFASALANRFGFRTVAIIGSILSSVAFGISYFASNITHLCIVYGIIGGIGYGLIYVPSIIIVGFYFEKWRALATGIASCGSGVGTFLFAPLYSMLVSNVGWRNTILVEAGFILLCAFFACTYKPLKPTKLKDLKKKEEFEKPELKMDSSQLPAITRMKMEAALANMKEHSYHTVSEHHTSTIPKILGVNNNAAYPNALEVFRHDKVYHTIHGPPHRLTQLHNEEKRLPIPFIEKDEQQTDKSNGTAPLLSEDNLSPISMNHRRHTLGEKRNRDGTKNRTAASIKDLNRPLYRDDIFFGASLTRLPQYTSQSSVAYNLSVVRPPTKTEIEEEEKQECRICPESIRRPLANMLDLDLLKSPSFMMLSISGFLTMASFYIPYMYIKDRATMNHMDENLASWLVATIGITNTIGRVLSGYICSLPKINVILVNNISLTIAGLATVLSDLWFSEVYQFTYCIIFGLTMACFSSIRSIMIVELVGLERLTNAFGIAMMFQGLGACIGAPIAGQIFTATGSYHASFLLSGGMILASVVLCYPLSIVNRWEKSKIASEKETSAAV